jgi:antitoxin (DNA-binding transcriptional repressor) of toxin-antitoxin stability system
MEPTKKEFTVEEFQENFDPLFERVENGETFTITDGPNRVLIMPIDQLPHQWRAST